LQFVSNIFFSCDFKSSSTTSCGNSFQEESPEIAS